MTKEFKNCKIDVDGYDSKGVKVFTEKNAEAGTYIVKFSAPGEYKMSFYNKEVGSYNARKLRSNYRLVWSATTAARSSTKPRKCSSTKIS